MLTHSLKTLFITTFVQQRNGLCETPRDIVGLSFVMSTIDKIRRIVGMFSITICSLSRVVCPFQFMSSTMSMTRFKVMDTFVNEECFPNLWYAGSWSEIDNKLQNSLHTNFLLSFINPSHVSHGCTSQFKLLYKSAWLSQTYFWSSQDQKKTTTTRWKIRHFWRPQTFTAWRNAQKNLKHAGFHIIMVARFFQVIKCNS